MNLPAQAATINAGTSEAATPLLELEKVTAFYGDLQALFGITLQVRAREIVTLIGSNGAGKTTLLRVISGVKHPRTGSLRFSGKDVGRVQAHEMVARGVSHVPEGRQVFPFLTVRENLSLGAYTRRARAAMKQSMQEQLELFPRLAERMQQMAGTLSGGEQQMLAIARAMMLEPRIILLDEPTEGLMPRMVGQIREIIEALRREGVAVLLVEQNVPLTLAASERVYILEKGVVRHHARSSELHADDGVIH